MVVTGTCWVEARAAVKHPTKVQVSHSVSSYPAPNVSGTHS